ncbi:MAG: hypothetical protein P9F75_07930 [Candidatus Contendobacter sp.]|nr:hypothetical protein [Candidatus Contendobacter sp.]
MIQEAIEVYFEGETDDMPPLTPLEVLARDPAYAGGVWNGSARAAPGSTYRDRRRWWRASTTTPPRIACPGAAFWPKPPRGPRE